MDDNAFDIPERVTGGLLAALLVYGFLPVVDIGRFQRIKTIYLIECYV
jgi:hypothetical protein